MVFYYFAGVFCFIAALGHDSNSLANVKFTVCGVLWYICAEVKGLRTDREPKG